MAGRAEKAKSHHDPGRWTVIKVYGSGESGPRGGPGREERTRSSENSIGNCVRIPTYYIHSFIDSFIYSFIQSYILYIHNLTRVDYLFI